jgi:hypothetical protein
VEESQLGVSSLRYVPGLYSPRESVPAAWDEAYEAFMRREIGESENRTIENVEAPEGNRASDEREMSARQRKQRP